MNTLFACVLFDFTRPLGPSEGRYIVGQAASDGSGTDVLDVRAIPAHVVIDAPRRRHRRGPEAEELVPISLVRYTLIRAGRPLAGEAAAQAWLAALSSDARTRAHEAQQAIAVLNTAIRAYRAAAGDPYAVEVSSSDACAVRFGAGTPRQVFDGELSTRLADDAQPPARRSAAWRGPDRLEPTRAVAAALAGRVEPLAAEDLILRTLLDLRHGAPAAAAATLLAAVELMATEATLTDAIDSSEELLRRARVVARGALASPAALETQASLRGLAGELHQRLHAITLERLEESDSALRAPPTRAIGASTTAGLHAVGAIPQTQTQGEPYDQ